MGHSQVAPGTIRSFGGGAVPYGWLLCNGTTLDSVANPQYAALFAWIGTTFGGTGASNFFKPDFRGRAAIGAGTGPGLSLRTLGSTVGTETHTLSPSETAVPVHDHPSSSANHGHTITDPNHVHGLSMGNNDSDNQSQIARADGESGVQNVTTSGAGTGITVNANNAVGVTIGAASGLAANPHPIMQPVLVVTKIVKW